MKTIGKIILPLLIFCLIGFVAALSFERQPVISRDAKVYAGNIIHINNTPAVNR